MAKTKTKQMKALRVSEDARKLMDKAVKKVAVETKGEVLGINASLEYILDRFLKEK